MSPELKVQYDESTAKLEEANERIRLAAVRRVRIIGELADTMTDAPRTTDFDSVMDRADATLDRIEAKLATMPDVIRRRRARFRVIEGGRS